MKFFDPVLVIEMILSIILKNSMIFSLTLTFNVYISLKFKLFKKKTVNKNFTINANFAIFNFKRKVKNQKIKRHLAYENSLTAFYLCIRKI